MLLTHQLHPYQGLINSSFQIGFITVSDLLNFNQDLIRHVYVLRFSRRIRGDSRHLQEMPSHINTLPQQATLLYAYSLLSVYRAPSSMLSYSRKVQ
jgi:hypothetical protein